MIKSYLLLFLMACPVMLQAQGEPTERNIREMVEKESEQKLVVQCSVLTQEGYSYYAEIIADRLIQFQPNSANYNYRKGYLMLDSHTDFVNAMKYLEVAAMNVKKKYDMYSSKETSAPTDVYYYLGRCYHLNEEIDKALELYNKFLSLTDPESELIPYAKLKIQQCEVAKREIANPKSARVENVGKKINSAFPEYSPVVSLDGSALYFTSKRDWADSSTFKYRDKRYNQYPEDIYVSYIDFEGSWIDPFRLEFCDGRRNEATMAVSTDERRIYVYQDTTGKGDIYYSDFTNNRFEEIQFLDDYRINTEHWEPHCMVTADGQNLYFTSDRPGGFGGRDIYRVIRLPDNTWSDPINLGPSVNTPFDEDAPFMAIDNKTLYYSSNGPLSMGDFDVFVTRRDVENNWSPPINLGYPLNSTGDDIYYTTTVDGLRGFLTSFRKGGYGEKDIYEIKNDFLGLNSIAVLKGQIKTLDNRPLPEDVAIKIVCLNCDEPEVRSVFPRLRDGIYFTSMEPCREYELIYNFDNGRKEIYRETVKTSCDKDYDEIYRDILIDVKDITNIKPINRPEGNIPKGVTPKSGKTTNDPVVTTDPKKTDSKPTDGKPKVKEKDLDPVTAGGHKNLKYKYFFEYNKNKINPKKGEFRTFVKAVNTQLAAGRTNISINVYSSASTVPTKKYESNAKLSMMRAENIKYDIMTYFQENSEYNDKIVVTIIDAAVAGPSYQKDAFNKKKYRQFQYVEIFSE